MRPDIIPARVVSEYRRLNIFTYLGLRYCLAAMPARRDHWSREVVADLIRRRGEPAYLPSSQFKELAPDGQKQFRRLHISPPSEVLAEAALFQACGQSGGRFARRDNVYSYRLANRQSRRGVFEPYMDGFRERQRDIQDLCARHPNDCVLFLDVKKFYPSIVAPVARSAWTEAAGQAGLSRSWSGLGHKLLEGQFAHADHLLTGPLFSHLIGNLVLDRLDAAMRGSFGNSCVRHGRCLGLFDAVFGPPPPVGREGKGVKG